MRLLNPKPLTLSPAQSEILEAFKGCKHTIYALAKKSGVAGTTIARTLSGEHEPNDFNRQCLLEAIELLKNEGTPFKWRNHIKEARAMLETKTLDDVAEHFGKSPDAVRCALQYAERRKAA